MAILNEGDLRMLIMDFEELEQMPDSVLEDMLTAAGKIVMDETKKKAKSMKVYDTGAMINDMKMKTPQWYRNTSSDREYRAYVTFYGSRKRANTTTRNGDIAFINEYGKHGQPARPFMLSAINACSERAIQAEEDVYDKWLKKNNF